MEKKNSGGRKSTVAGYEERIPIAMEWILYDKINSIEFREKASKAFGISTRAADAIWADCKNRIRERFKEQSDEILDQQLQRSFDLLKRAKDSGNRRVEAEVLRDISKLYGLDTKKVDITSNGQPISININLTD